MRRGAMFVAFFTLVTPPYNPQYARNVRQISHIWRTPPPLRRNMSDMKSPDFVIFRDKLVV